LLYLELIEFVIILPITESNLTGIHSIFKYLLLTWVSESL